MKDFVSTYMELCDLENSEAPALYHRWVCMSILGAYIGRKAWIEFGSSKIYPNQYIMLMGSPGTRKGSAMGIGKILLKEAGFQRFSADKTSKERFLMDMKQMDLDIEDIEELTFDEPSESYIMSGEFTDFIGQGNMDFVTLLTNLWDNLNEYKHPKIQGKSVVVHKPTVNLLGANTAEGFALAFPPEALGNGFLSRVLLVHAEVTGRRIAWPSAQDPLVVQLLAKTMQEVKKNFTGQIPFTVEAKQLASKIYNNEIPVDDARFSHYQQRRYIHMLKLSLLLALFDLNEKILPIHVLRANTLLVTTERVMPRALGEFGASKNSMVAGKIIAHLNSCFEPQTPTQLWKVVSRDLSKLSDLTDIINSLKAADKIQAVNLLGKAGWMAKNDTKKEWGKDLLDLEWLTESERF